MVRINGEERDWAGRTLTGCLAELGFDPARVAAERNGDIVPRNAFDQTVLQDGDRWEVVCFVGGG